MLDRLGGPPFASVGDVPIERSRSISARAATMFIKVCGITTEEDALLAVALGADALGFVFAPGSPRQVTRETVGAILHRLPPGAVFDWALAEGVPAGVRLLLAGGLNAENVAQAIRRVRPWGVDVSSGVET